MIFVSTGGFRGKTAYETCKELYKSGIREIELSGGKYSENYLIEWTVKSTDIISEEIITESYFNEYSGNTHPYYSNSINLVLNIERNSAHYIYKIIIEVITSLHG